MGLTEEERKSLLEKVERFKSKTENFNFIELLLDLQREFGEKSLEMADVFLKECNIPPCPMSY